MENIRVTFLGTGNAIPTELRNHTGILVTYKDENILFDCGEGIQRQFRLAKISPSKLTRIFITHWHRDHVLGLPGLFQTLAMSNYTKRLKIYGPVGTREFISLITKLLMSIKIDLEIEEVHPGRKIEEKDFIIEAESMSHGTPTLAYSFTIKDKLRLDKKKIKKLKLPNSPLLAKLQSGEDIIFNKKKVKAKDVTYKEEGKKLAIILDTSMNANIEKIAKNSDLLITESTFLDKEAEKAKEYKHLTAKQAAEIAKKAKAKKLILTHISQRYEHNLPEVEREARKVFKNTLVVKDLDSVEI